MTHHRPSNAVVVGVDGSPTSALALDWAVDEASRRRLALHLVNAWFLRYAQASPMLVAPLDIPDPEALLRDAVARVATLAPGLRVSTEYADSPAAAALVVASATADSVVVGSRGHGTIGRAIVGSTSMQVATHAACPVVVVREVPRVLDAIPRVVVGVDGSAVSTEAVAYAFAQASMRGLGLTVVHAWHLDAVGGVVAAARSSETEWQRLVQEEYALTSESLAGWCEKYPDVDVRNHVVRQHPVDALVSESRSAELVVVGSRGHGGFRGLLIGSVSQGVLHRVHCPVAVVRPRASLTLDAPDR